MRDVPRGGQAGVVAVHEDTDVGVHDLEDPLHDEAFAASRFRDDASTGLSGSFGRFVRGSVVENADLPLGTDSAEVVYDFGDGGCFVVAGNSDRNTRAQGKPPCASDGSRTLYRSGCQQPIQRPTPGVREWYSKVLSKHMDSSLVAEAVPTSERNPVGRR